MSQENVEVVRESLSAFTDDDVGEMHGPKAVRRYLQDWLDMFDDVTSVPEELLDLGDGRVLAVQHATGRARASGVRTDIRYAVVYTLRDGKIVRGREYIDRNQAVEAVAAGLGGRHRRTAVSGTWTAYSGTQSVWPQPSSGASPSATAVARARQR